MIEHPMVVLTLVIMAASLILSLTVFSDVIAGWLAPSPPKPEKSNFPPGSVIENVQIFENTVFDPFQAVYIAEASVWRDWMGLSDDDQEQILESLDPEWSAHFLGDVERGLEFYSEHPYPDGTTDVQRAMKEIES